MLNDFILSGSGDGTLRLWDFHDGNLLDKLTLHTPVQSIVELQDMAVIQMYDSNKLHFIKTEKQANQWGIKNILTMTFEDNVSDLASCGGNQLWIIVGNSVHMYTIDLKNNIFTRNRNDEMKQIFETLDNLVRSFVCLENTNLMIFLHKKMIDKQKRTEQFTDISSIVCHSKRIKY